MIGTTQKTYRHADAGLTAAFAAAGGQAELARKLGRTRGALAQWRSVPTALVLRVEGVTGVPRTVLRPDIYPPEEPNVQI